MAKLRKFLKGKDIMAAAIAPPTTTINEGKSTKADSDDPGAERTAPSNNPIASKNPIRLAISIGVQRWGVQGWRFPITPGFKWNVQTLPLPKAAIYAERDTKSDTLFFSIAVYDVPFMPTQIL